MPEFVAVMPESSAVMSESGRVLHFRARTSPTATLPPADVEEGARQYLAVPAGERSPEFVQSTLRNTDVLFALCGILREQRDVRPAVVADEAATIYRWISDTEIKIGMFDERDYLLGESAFLAGGAFRQLGRRDEATRWFDRAEAGFRNTVNPTPGLSNVSYARLALRFEMGQYQDVLELIPSLRASFERAASAPELAKCHLLEAMVLKHFGKYDAAVAALDAVESLPLGPKELALRARILAESGDLHQLNGDSEKATKSFRSAMSLLEGGDLCIALADLKAFVGNAFWCGKAFGLALESFRSAMSDYRELGMATRVAYLHLFLADTLLRLGREREAEWEILAALPTIEEQKMVPEGFAAVGLLRESVRRRKADPNALRELREHLQAAS